MIICQMKKHVSAIFNIFLLGERKTVEKLVKFPINEIELFYNVFQQSIVQKRIAIFLIKYDTIVTIQIYSRQSIHIYRISLKWNVFSLLMKKKFTSIYDFPLSHLFTKQDTNKIHMFIFVCVQKTID